METRQLFGTVLVLVATSFASPAQAELAGNPEKAPPLKSNKQLPFNKMVEDLGAQLGLKLKVDRVALNPFAGQVVLRGLKASTDVQGDFLQIKKVGVLIDIAGQSLTARDVEIEGAILDLDMSKNELGATAQKGQSPGKLAKARLLSGEAVLRYGKQTILLAHKLKGVATDLSMCGADSSSPCGTLSLTGGEGTLGPEKRMAFEKLRAKVRLKGRNITVESLEGTMSGGSFSCVGKVAVLAGFKRGATKMECSLDRVRLVYEDLVDVVVTGKVHLSSKGKGRLTLSGDLNASGGKVLKAGSFGSKTKGPLAAKITVRVKAPSGSVKATIAGGLGGAKIRLSGKKASNVQWVSGLLDELAQKNAPTQPSP